LFNDHLLSFEDFVYVLDFFHNSHQLGVHILNLGCVFFSHALNFGFSFSQLSVHLFLIVIHIRFDFVHTSPGLGMDVFVFGVDQVLGMSLSHVPSPEH
jgi:hypothetical protein